MASKGNGARCLSSPLGEATRVASGGGPPAPAAPLVWTRRVQTLPPEGEENQRVRVFVGFVVKLLQTPGVGGDGPGQSQ
jgi:hypothetical protein